MDTRFAFDVIGILDALYKVEDTTAAWEAGVIGAAHQLLNQGGGVGMVRYDLAGRGPLSSATLAGSGVPDGWDQYGIDQHRNPALAGAIRQTYASLASGNTRRMMPDGFDDYRRIMNGYGLDDQWMVNGLTANGTGAALYLFGRTQIAFGPRQRQMLSALARHIGTAYRLHQQIAQRGSFRSVEAILNADGKLDHATPATQSAVTRRALAKAVSLRGWARRGRDAPDKRMRAFKGIVNATWTLVDWLDRDGKRYVLACRNLVADLGMAALSAREHEVAMLAKDGQSNKHIAYELGLAHSTVRVLLARAAIKLGVRSRSELIHELTRASIA